MSVQTAAEKAKCQKIGERGEEEEADLRAERGRRKKEEKRGTEREDLACFKQERSRRRCKEEPGESCLSSSPPSLFQLWISVALLPPSHPLFLSSNRVYPSGFFAPISSPPAVLEEPFTAASAESVTLASLALCFSHTFSFPLSHTHTSRDSPQPSSFSNTFFPPILHFPSLSSHYILSDLFHIILLPPLLLFSVTRHSFVYLTMFHISLSVLGTSRYLSVYPSLTSIYSFNPSWPEDISPTIPFLLSHPGFLTLSLLPSYLPPLPSAHFLIFFCNFLPFPPIRSLSPCRAELHHIPDQFFLPSFSVPFLPPPPPLCCYSLFFFLSASQASGPRAK